MRTGILVVLLATACNTAKKDCEHARDVMATEWQRQAKEAIATVAVGQRQELERQAAKEVEHLRNVFVDICVAQPEATRSCIARIDELLAAERDYRKARDRCSPADDACRAAAKTASESKVGSCADLMDELIDEVNKGL